jgi:molybdopterin-guanine dinucleotide biosynthesis protein A
LLDRVTRKADIIIPSTSAGYEPMFAVYKKTCLPAMAWLLGARSVENPGAVSKSARENG